MNKSQYYNCIFVKYFIKYNYIYYVTNLEVGIMSVANYKNEIRTILSEVKNSFKNENVYDYDLYGLYCEIEKDFKSIENGNTSEELLIKLHNRTLELLK